MGNALVLQACGSKFNPQNHTKHLRGMAWNCTEKVETGESLGLASQPVQLSLQAPGPDGSPCFKKQCGEPSKKKFKSTSGLYTHKHTQEHTGAWVPPYTCTHIPTCTYIDTEIKMDRKISHLVHPRFTCIYYLSTCIFNLVTK